jgi:ribosomal protein L12E/L44/L45/RPP1/RPP2
MLLSFQVNWRIKQLVRKLAENNIKESLEEIEILFKMNSDDTRISLISALLDEIDLKDIRLNGSRDPQKVCCSSIFILSST